MDDAAGMSSTLPEESGTGYEIFPSDTGIRERCEALARRFVAAQLAGDRHAAVRIVLDDGLGRGVTVPDLYLKVLSRAQHEVGRMWQTNQINVAQEHLATAITQLALAHLYPVLPRQRPNGKRVIVACVPDEQHDMGARIAADFFEMAGFDVRYLGANVPTDSLIAMIQAEPPDLVALSVTMTDHVPALRETAARMREITGDRVRLAIGGAALDWIPSLADQIGADIVEQEPNALIAAARRLLGVGA